GRVVPGQAGASRAGRPRAVAARARRTGHASGAGGMTPPLPLEVLLLIGLLSPVGLLLILGAASLINRSLPERWIGRLAAIALTTCAAALISALLVHAA